MLDKLINQQNNTDLPLVSFIVPCYNLPTGMIRECLDSILSLPLDDNEREVILVDDGSSTNMLDVLWDYCNKFVYIRQSNKGLSSARNVGIEIAKGKYIQFVDGDDCLLPYSYKECLDFTLKNDADMVLFQFTAKQARPQSKAVTAKFYGPTSGREYMRHNNLRAAACGYIFKRDILGTLRFHQGIIHEDEEFTPQLMLRAEKVFETQLQAYFYRQHENTITSRKGNRWALKQLTDTEEVLSVLRGRADVLPYGDRAALQRRIDQLTMDYLYNVIVLTRSRHYLEKSIKRLRDKGLFPLPKQDYTVKYKYFSHMINSKTGRQILLATLPVVKTVVKSK